MGERVYDLVLEDDGSTPGERFYEAGGLSVPSFERQAEIQTKLVAERTKFHQVAK